MLAMLVMMRRPMMMMMNSSNMRLRTYEWMGWKDDECEKETAAAPIQYVQCVSATTAHPPTPLPPHIPWALTSLPGNNAPRPQQSATASISENVSPSSPTPSLEAIPMHVKDIYLCLTLHYAIAIGLVLAVVVDASPFSRADHVANLESLLEMS
jgi:hypothetical protein